MDVAISGTGGLIGSALASALKTSGARVTRLVRGEPRGLGPEARWGPDTGLVDPERLEGVEAVVHLAGETIEGRWTAAKKRRMWDTRVEGTRRLVGSLVHLARRPAVFLCASAVGYYGDRGEKVLTEGSEPGADFLARLCVNWEEAARPAALAGIRVINLRSGMVLSTRGGALARMLTPFRLGLGGPIGGGRQYWTWITLDDVVGAIRYALDHEALAGPVNAVAPQQVTNGEFTRTLGRVLRRPAVLPVPAFAARIAFGEMAPAFLLASQRVRPARLEEEGYEFRDPELEPALRRLLT